MKTINQFLNSHVEPFLDNIEKVDCTENEIENIRELFIKQSKAVNRTKHLKIQPRIQKGQIWTVTNNYDDFQCISQKPSHPFIVLINSEPDDIEGETFVRVLIISPFIEMAAKSDEICRDSSIIGFPFLVENWNDQPILTELLDEYIGYYEMKSKSFAKSKVLQEAEEPISEDYNESSETLSKHLQEFRDIEISRAKYINHSVLSLLSFLENRQSQDAGVVISLFGKTAYPKFYVDQTQKEPTFALAAKSGIDSEDKYLLFNSDSLPFKIFIRKNEDGFILSVDSTEKMELFSNLNKVFTGISNKEKTVFANLKAGNYTLIAETFKQLIKIRLK